MAAIVVRLGGYAWRGQISFAQKHAMCSYRSGMCARDAQIHSSVSAHRRAGVAVARRKWIGAVVAIVDNAAWAWSAQRKSTGVIHR